MDAIAPGTAPGDDNQVAGSRLGGTATARRETDCATEDERIGYVPPVEQRRAVDGGDTHLVAIVGDAGHHTRVDPLRWQRSRRECVRRCIERAEAEDVSVGDRFGRDPEYVTHHPTHPGIRAAER